MIFNFSDNKKVYKINTLIFLNICIELSSCAVATLLLLNPCRHPCQKLVPFVLLCKKSLCAIHNRFVGLCRDEKQQSAFSRHLWVCRALSCGNASQLHRSDPNMHSSSNRHCIGPALLNRPSAHCASARIR